MGNLQKITKAQAKAVMREIERYPDSLGNIPHFNHEVHEIDYTRTHLNYRFTFGTDSQGMNSTEKLEQRLSEVKVLNRDDVKVIGSWVWQMPKDLPEEYEEQFFRGIAEFYAIKHGAENIAYATVHKDERTPHIHIGIIPVSKNSKGVDRVSAKDVFNKAYLNTAHGDLQAFLTKKLGIEVNLLTGETLGVDGIKNYKRVKDLHENIEQLVEIKNDLEQDIQTLQKTKNSLKNSISALTDKEEELIQRNINLGKQIEKTQDNLIDVLDQLSQGRQTLQAMKDFFKAWPNYFVTVARWVGKKLGFKIEDSVVKQYESEFNRDLENVLSSSKGYIEKTPKPKRNIDRGISR